MVYDKSIFPVLPNWNISLGVWHTYKQAVFKVYQAFSLDFFGPFFHSMFPKDKFKPKPKFLTQPESMLVSLVINHEYGAEFNKLSKDGRLSHNARNHAHNMYTLIEYFAPQVSHSICSPV